MMYLKAFIFAGLVCLISQVVLDNTKVTPGHITSSLTVIGALLSFLGIYDKIVSCFGAGATILISNFGHMLYAGAITGFEECGALGIFTGMLGNTGISLVSVIVFSFVFTLLFKAKD